MSIERLPYEAMSRDEADDILCNLPTALVGMTIEQVIAVKELVADGVSKGINLGFSINDFCGANPADVASIYNAGVAEGMKERKDIIGE